MPLSAVNSDVRQHNRHARVTRVQQSGGESLKKLLLITLVLLSGCATQVVPFSVQGIERSEHVRVQDLRPQTERQGEIFSLMITNDAYALYRIAESASVPTAMRLLQHRAYEMRTGSEPFELKVHHLVVYRNLQSELRRGAIGAGIGGIIGALVAGQSVTDPSGAVSSLVDPVAFNSLSATEYKRALYTEQENPGRGSIHIVYIETEIKGKRVFTRTMVPMRVKDGENPLATALEAAARYHLTLH